MSWGAAADLVPVARADHRYLPLLCCFVMQEQWMSFCRIVTTASMTRHCRTRLLTSRKSRSEGWGEERGFSKCADRCFCLTLKALMGSYVSGFMLVSCRLTQKFCSWHSSFWLCNAHFALIPLESSAGREQATATLLTRLRFICFKHIRIHLRLAVAQGLYNPHLVSRHHVVPRWASSTPARCPWVS